LKESVYRYSQEGIRDKISIKDVVRFLNEFVFYEQSTVERLLASRVGCSSWVSGHPAIQCLIDPFSGKVVVGILGFLNGLFGKDESGNGPICANFEIVCPKESLSQEEHKNALLNPETKVGSPCPVCGEILKVGRLLGFTTNWESSSETKVSSGKTTAIKEKYSAKKESEIKALEKDTDPSGKKDKK